MILFLLALASMISPSIGIDWALAAVNY